jgi:hypothetical protein
MENGSTSSGSTKSLKKIQDEVIIPIPKKSIKRIKSRVASEYFRVPYKITNFLIPCF